MVYGYPIAPWPYWYPYPGIWFGGPYLSFGVGFGIGFFGGFGWGWGHWGFDWHNRYTIYNHNRYYSRSTTFYNRNNYYRGGGERGVATNVQRGLTGNRGEGERGGAFNRPGPAAHSYSGNTQAARGTVNPAARAATAVNTANTLAELTTIPAQRPGLSKETPGCARIR